jgi:hypothetical protein
MGDSFNLLRPQSRQLGAFREVLSQKAIRILVGALPSGPLGLFKPGGLIGPLIFRLGSIYVVRESP